MKMSDMEKKIDRIQWALEQERDKRHREKHEFLKDQWKLESRVNDKAWQTHQMISMHRQEIDQLMQRQYMLEQRIKELEKK